MASENQKAKVKQATELLEQGVEDIFTSGRMAEYLTIMSKFHNYSARNCMLIMMQCPEATHVASYKRWQKEFNRQVRKGEKAIRILAPITHKQTIRETNKDTGEATDHEHVWMSFKAVPVFDISQTEGDDLPEIAHDLTGDVEGFGKLAEAIEGCTTAKVVYGWEFSDPECHGSFNRIDNTIKIADGLSQAQTIKTLVHEAAHSLLHCEDGEQADAKREMREVQAEGVAFVVCNALGIDSGDYSFGYVAGWGQDSKEIMRELEVIRSTANMILDKVA